MESNGSGLRTKDAVFAVISVILWIFASGYYLSGSFRIGNTPCSWYSSLKGQAFPGGMCIAFFLFAIIYALHKSGRGKLVSSMILRAVSVNNPEEAKEHLAKEFPSTIYSLIMLSISFLIFSESILSVSVSNQLYGLVLDGFGGSLLAAEILYNDFRLLEAEDRSAIRIEGVGSKVIIYNFWGILFLVLGFSLQIISTLPWKVFCSFG